jgi:rod shape-determining protein MreC
MGEFGRRVRIAVLVAALVAVALVSMVSDRRAWMAAERELPWGAGAILDVAVPIQKAIAMPVDFARDAWTRYVALMGVRDENERLRQVAEMRDDFEIPMLPSELVGGGVSPWFRSVMFDRGRSDGVRPGMPVISEDGLVGLVTAASHRASRTMLLLDRQSAVDGTVQRSRARGIVRGLGRDDLEFEFVVRVGDVRVGDVVITSGLGGVYPKGLRIGRVTALSEPGARLLQTATVAPAVDFGRLEQVFVMLRRGPTMELLYEAGGPGMTADAAPPKPAS